MARHLARRRAQRRCHASHGGRARAVVLVFQSQRRIHPGGQMKLRGLALFLTAFCIAALCHSAEAVENTQPAEEAAAPEVKASGSSLSSKEGEIVTLKKKAA